MNNEWCGVRGLETHDGFRLRRWSRSSACSLLGPAGARPFPLELDQAFIAQLAQHPPSPLVADARTRILNGTRSLQEGVEPAPQYPHSIAKYPFSSPEATHRLRSLIVRQPPSEQQGSEDGFEARPSRWAEAGRPGSSCRFPLSADAPARRDGLCGSSTTKPPVSWMPRRRAARGRCRHTGCSPATRSPSRVPC